MNKKQLRMYRKQFFESELLIFLHKKKLSEFLHCRDIRKKILINLIVNELCQLLVFNNTVRFELGNNYFREVPDIKDPKVFLKRTNSFHQL